MKYYNIHINLNTPYEWGSGWQNVDDSVREQFNTNLDNALDEMQGEWAIGSEWHSGERYNVDDPHEEIYVHPMEITGCISEENVTNLLAGLEKFSDSTMSIAVLKQPQEVEFLSLQEVYDRLEEHIGNNKENMNLVCEYFHGPHGVPMNAITNLKSAIGEDILHLKSTNFCDTEINNHLSLCEDLVYKYLQFRPFPSEIEYLKNLQEFCRENKIEGNLVNIVPSLYKEHCVDKQKEEKNSDDFTVKGVNQKLITQELLDKIPALYKQDDKGGDTIAYAKFFVPNGNFTWYMTEYNPETKEAFGWVEGLEAELGYFSINEFVHMNTLFEQKPSLSRPWIERDAYFKPCALKEIKSYARKFGLDKEIAGNEQDRNAIASEITSDEHENNIGERNER